MRAATKEGWKHHTDNLAQQFLLAPQTPFDLGDQAFGEPQVLQSLLQGFSGLLRLAAVSFEALLCGAITTASGFGVFVCTSFGWGHGDSFALCGSWVDGVKDTRPRQGESGAAL